MVGPLVHKAFAIGDKYKATMLSNWSPMATHTTPSAERIASFLEDYFASPLESVRGIPQGSVNSNFEIQTRARRYFLRIYEEQDLGGAIADARLAFELGKRGVKTPEPIARKDGAFVGPLAGKPAALFEWVHGDMLCQKKVTPSVAESVGRQLGRIHGSGLQTLARPSRFGPPDLFKRIDTIEADLAWREVGQRLRSQLDSCLVGRSDALAQGLVHGDLFRDNILWSGETICALLDFESASLGAYAFDLAVTLLAWCVGDDFDRALARAMVRGYEQERVVGAEEREGIFFEARFAAIRFSITRVTDYAMRAQVGHERVMKDYKRFEARLAMLDDMGAAGFKTSLFSG